MHVNYVRPIIAVGSKLCSLNLKLWRIGCNKNLRNIKSVEISFLDHISLTIQVRPDYFTISSVNQNTTSSFLSQALFVRPQVKMVEFL